MVKNGWAAFLNFIIWGSGYLCVKKRTALGWWLLAGYILIHWYWFSIGIATAWTTIPGSLAGLGHLAVSIGLAYDVCKC